jgi:enoyl-CoA hydratase/carnithine racemase
MSDTLQSNILIERDGPVTVISINRPERRNAVDGRTSHELYEAFLAFDADESASVAVFTGVGDTFCAGADLKAMAVGDREKRREVGGRNTMAPMGPSRLQLSKPVIAAIEGYAVAGGTELALWADLRVVSETAIFGIFCRRFGVPLIDMGTIRLPRLIGQFCQKYPDIDISLEILNRDGVLTRMRENLDDLYIMSQPPTDLDLADEIFLLNPLVPIAAYSHPLTKKTSVPLQSFLDQRFILREKGSGTRMTVDKYFKSQKFRPNIRMELGSNEAIKEAVAGGLGIGVVSKHALHGHQKEHGVAVINVKGFPVMSHWHIVHPAKKQLPPVAVAFKLHLLNSVRNIKS